MAEQRKKCVPGCTCKRHARVPLIDWNDPEARKAYNRQRAKEKYEANPELYKERARQCRSENPGRRWAQDPEWRLKLYGISLARMAQMLIDQNSCCYLCGNPLDTEAPRGVHIDHDHSCCRNSSSCGQCVRGLACESCNVGIGRFDDDPVRMRRVADALEAANLRVRGNGG